MTTFATTGMSALGPAPRGRYVSGGPSLSRPLSGEVVVIPACAELLDLVAGFLASSLRQLLLALPECVDVSWCHHLDG